MWVTHRHRADINPSTPYLQAVGVSPLGGIERQTTRLEARYAHVYRDDVLTLHASANESSGAIHGHGTRAGLTTTIEERGDTAGTIATLFNLDPISIEDPIEHRCIRTPGLLQDQCLIETDTRVPVCELPELFGRRRSAPWWQIEH